MSSPQIHMWIRGGVHLQACVRDERESDASAGRRHREEKRGNEQTPPLPPLFSLLSSPLHLCHMHARSGEEKTSHRYKKRKHSPLNHFSVVMTVSDVHNIIHSSEALVVAGALFVSGNQIAEIFFFLPPPPRRMYYIILKGKCADFTRRSLLTSLEDGYCMCENKLYKPQSLLNCLK